MPDVVPTPTLPALAVSMGDPAGIGLDIALAAWLRRRELVLPPFFMLADPVAVGHRSALLGLDVPLVRIETMDAVRAQFDSALPVLPVPITGTVTPGQPTIEHAQAIITAIELGVQAVASADASALVTCPIAKSVLYEAGFKHSGHTEFLAELATRSWMGLTAQPIMLLASLELLVVPMTIHIPLADVPAAITRDRIIQTAKILHHALTRDFQIVAPRIAVAGLNPHAGEDGTIGHEEVDVIEPALRRLREMGMDISGPLSADTMFHAAARKTYDGAIAMYHDQALIPIKTLAFDSGVNVTLGLPFVRTSPDHGTAFSLAGTGGASPTSFIEALRLAARMASARAIHAGRQ